MRRLSSYQKSLVIYETSDKETSETLRTKSRRPWEPQPHGEQKVSSQKVGVVETSEISETSEVCSRPEVLRRYNKSKKELGVFHFS